MLAGGQSLVPMMNMRLARPGVVVDINRLPALDYLTQDGGALRIGALCRQRAVERSALVAEHCPLLRDALALIGHLADPQPRHGRRQHRPRGSGGRALRRRSRRSAGR